MGTNRLEQSPLFSPKGDFFTVTGTPQTRKLPYRHLHNGRTPFLHGLNPAHGGGSGSVCAFWVTTPRDSFASSLPEVSASHLTPRMALTLPDKDNDPWWHAMLHSASEHVKTFAITPGGSRGGPYSPDIPLLWKAILGNVLALSRMSW